MIKDDTQHETFYVLIGYHYPDGKREMVAPVKCQHRPYKATNDERSPVYKSYVGNCPNKEADNMSCPLCYPPLVYTDERKAPGA